MWKVTFSICHVRMIGILAFEASSFLVCLISISLLYRHRVNIFNSPIIQHNLEQKRRKRVTRRKGKISRLRNILIPFFLCMQTATSIGQNPTNVVNSGQPGPIPVSSRVPVVVPAPAPALQIPTHPLSVPSSTQFILDMTTESVNSNNQVTSLLTPSAFFTPSSSLSGQSAPLVSSSMPTAIHPHSNAQRSYGTPMLQPFPPPSPPVSFTPIPSPSLNHGSLSRDQVRDALLVLVQVCPVFLLLPLLVKMLLVLLSFSLSGV